MKQLTILTDPVFHPENKLRKYEIFFLKLIGDKRDLPFIFLLINIHFTVVLPAILLYTSLFKGQLWWIVFIPYFFLSQFYYKGRFGLMFHCICHRKIFKKKYRWMHAYVTWFIAPFFGHSPESYFSHHIGMHHMENNMPEDSSCTMGYQRDSFRAFLIYYFKFLLFGFKTTFLYLYYRKRKKMYEHLALGELFFYVFCIIMCFINFKATFFILIVPFFWGRLIMMLGNWTQHAFIDPQNPENIYTNSINCINTSYNKKCWNDGYHTIHHLRPGMHYTEIPAEFLKQKETLAFHKTLVFDGIHYLHIFIYIMTKRYDKLAGNLVNINNTFSDDQEAIQLMKSRIKLISTKTLLKIPPTF